MHTGLQGKGQAGGKGAPFRVVPGNGILYRKEAFLLQIFDRQPGGLGLFRMLVIPLPHLLIQKPLVHLPQLVQRIDIAGRGQLHKGGVCLLAFLAANFRTGRPLSLPGGRPGLSENPCV